MALSPELETALAHFERASGQFDELYTSLTLVQRQLLGLRRTLGATVPTELDELGERNLIQKLHEVTVALDDLERFTTPGRKPRNDGRQFTPRPDLAVVRQRLADHTLTPSDLRDGVLTRHRRDAFAAIELVAEYMEDDPENDLGFSRVPIGALLLLIHHIGQGTVEKIFAEAELPENATFGQLGPGDSARLSEALDRRVKY